MDAGILRPATRGGTGKIGDEAEQAVLVFSRDSGLSLDILFEIGGCLRVQPILLEGEGGG